MENVDIYGSASVAAVLGRTVNCKAVIDNVDVGRCYKIGNSEIFFKILIFMFFEVDNLFRE